MCAKRFGLWTNSTVQSKAVCNNTIWQFDWLLFDKQCKCYKLYSSLGRCAKTKWPWLNDPSFWPGEKWKISIRASFLAKNSWFSVRLWHFLFIKLVSNSFGCLPFEDQLGVFRCLKICVLKRSPESYFGCYHFKSK